MKLLFAKTFTARSTRRPGDLPAKPVTVEVFENGGHRWIKGLRLAPMLGISTSSLRHALKTCPELQDNSHNQLVTLEGDLSGPFRMLTIEGAQRLVNRAQTGRRVAVRAFLDDIGRR